MIYVVAYDLKDPNTPQDYENMATAIKGVGPWARVEKSVWLVESPKTYIEVRDQLKVTMREQDILFVAKLSGGSAWKKLPKDVSDWILNASSRGAF